MLKFDLKKEYNIIKKNVILYKIMSKKIENSYYNFFLIKGE